MMSFRTKLAVAGCALLLSLGVATAQAEAASPIGDLHPSYTFEPTGETMSYRLYVPSNYDGKRAMPLAVLLHGAGGDENSVFKDDVNGAGLKKLADQHGYIVLAPRGYNGGYGNIYPVVVTKETAARASTKGADSPGKKVADGLPPPPTTVAVPVDDYAEQAAGELAETHASKLSEEEVLAAIADVRKNYNIDPSKLYLSGNSMGGVGTAYLAAKYPTTWAAVAPGGGPLAAWSYPFERLRNNKLPALYIHGELDEHSNPHWSEVVFNAAKTEGVDAQLLIVKGGHHRTAWADSFPQIFDFFDAHHR